MFFIYSILDVIWEICVIVVICFLLIFDKIMFFLKLFGESCFYFKFEINNIIRKIIFDINKFIYKDDIINLIDILIFYLKDFLRMFMKI